MSGYYPLNQNGFQRNLDVSDIDGAQPRRLYSHESLSQAGSQIMKMPAGFNKSKAVAMPGMISDVWNLGSQFDANKNRPR